MAQCNLLVVEVLQRNRHFVFSLLVEDYFESASVVVDFEQRAHGLLLLGSNATHDDDLHTNQMLDSPFSLSQGYSAVQSHVMTASV